MPKYKVNAFVGVFEDKLDKIRKKLKKELEKPKAERKRESLKAVLKEAKALRNMIREMKDDHAVEVKCPHCGERFNL